MSNSNDFERLEEQFRKILTGDDVLGRTPGQVIRSQADYAEYKELLKYFGNVRNAIMHSDLNREKISFPKGKAIYIADQRGINDVLDQEIEQLLNAARSMDKTPELKTAGEESPASPQPPTNAEFILHLLLKKDERDAVIGDLLERYPKKVERFGERRAKLWFWGEVIRSLWPLIKRACLKTGLVALGEWIWRHIP
jgi:hypothetical protein